MSVFDKKMSSLQKQLNIYDITQGSNEAEIREISLTNNTLNLLACLPYFGERKFRTNDDDAITVWLKITGQVFQVHIPPASTFPFPAHFRLHNLQGLLKTNIWGYYVPSVDKSEFFRHQKLGYSLAYGYHHKKFPWLFNIISGSCVADILIANLDCIEFWLVDAENEKQ